MVKYYVDQEITINCEKFRISFAPNCNYSFIFSLIQNYLVYQYSDSTCLRNDEYVFGPPQIFGKFELTFEL
jgi:hypothetical protein